MRCKNCGYENPADNWFCGHCGTPLFHRHAAKTEPPGRPPAPRREDEPLAPTHDDMPAFERRARTPATPGPRTSVEAAPAAAPPSPLAHSEPPWAPAPPSAAPVPPPRAHAGPPRPVEPPTARRIPDPVKAYEPPRVQVGPPRPNEPPRSYADSPKVPDFPRPRPEPPQTPFIEPPRSLQPRVPEAPRHDRGISGPSFLGLADGGSESSDLEYLYEDEPPRRHARLIVAVLVLLAFGVFIAYKWGQASTWYTTIVKSSAATTQQQPEQQKQPEPTKAAADTRAPSPANTEQKTDPAKPATSDTANPPAQQKRSDDTKSDDSAPAPSESRAQPEEQEPPQVSPAEATKPDANRSAVRQEKTRTPAKSASLKSRARTEPVVSARTTESEQLLSRGKQYLYGIGVPRNCNQALVYLNSAAGMGNAKARSQLGALYATGHCVRQDRAKAYEYFTQARDGDQASNVWIERNRAMLWNQMSDAERQRAKLATMY